MVTKEELVEFVFNHKKFMFSPIEHAEYYLAEHFNTDDVSVSYDKIQEVWSISVNGVGMDFSKWCWNGP